MKSLKAVLLFVAMFSAFAGLSAQTEPEWQWASKATSTYRVSSSDSDIDDAGNSYVTGIFQDTASFGATTLTTSFIHTDIFVCKLDTDGNFLWAKQAGGADDDYSYDITVDSAGNCYVTGCFEGIATFGTTTLISIGNRDIFVCKLDSDGNFLWARQAGGTSSTDAQSIALDSAGNIYVTGCFWGTASFDAISLTVIGCYDIFICKLDANFLWAVQAGGTSIERGNDIAVDSAGNSYVTGYFYGTASFGATILHHSGSSDTFICKLDADGNFLWAKQAGSTGSDYGESIDVDSYGNSYVMGNFEGIATFGTTTLTSSGSVEIFICKLDADGNFLWAKKACGARSDLGYGIAVDGSGNSHVTGVFRETASFGATTLIGNGPIWGPDNEPIWYPDIFVCKLDSAGNFLWAIQAGGEYVDGGHSIAVDSTGNNYVAGEFEGTANFGDITLTGLHATFVAMLGTGVPVDDPAAPELSGQSLLYPIWPNPCRQGQTATLKARVEERETAILSVYNLRGQLLSRRELATGEHEIGLDTSGLLPGLYFHRLETPSGVQLRKLVIIK
jgi:hypothetical protein